MKKYAIITENDISQWSDDTGVLYHFPKRYLKYLSPGTRIIYYKGALKNKEFSNKRLSDKPHYFGIATIGKNYKDTNSKKGDYFAVVKNYSSFFIPVLAKADNKYLEQIPENRKSNYWRDGVRPINEETYFKIINFEVNNIGSADVENSDEIFNDIEPQYESFIEGNKKSIVTTKYERNPKLRKQALAIHGYDCAACGFNFGDFYGEVGVNYIHIHHIKPLFENDDERMVDPETDLIPLCANCHSIVHRKKSDTLSLENLKKAIQETKIN